MATRSKRKVESSSSAQAEEPNERLDQIMALLTQQGALLQQQGQRMDNLEQGARSRQAEEETRKRDEDQHSEALRKREEELWKKREDEQMAEALRRSEVEKKAEADRRSALLNSDRIQIAADLSKDLKKVTPPTFHGRASGEDAEAWITSMEKYFLV